MAIVESFGRGMVEAFLEDSELHYLRDRDGDFVVEFGYDEEVLGHPRFMLVVAGDEGDQYCLRGETMRRIARADWERSLRLCNEWNTQYKLPKVYLEIDDPNVSTSGRVVCEQWTNFEAGVHQELISAMTSTFFTACFGFWRWLERQDAIHALGDDAETDPDPEPTSRDDVA